MAAKEGDIVTIERLVHTKYIDVNAANDGVYDDDDDKFFIKLMFTVGDKKVNVA